MRRRDFLLLGAAGACLAGCDAAWVARREAGDGPFAPPPSGDIDDVAHVLSRLTFGARPGDRERVLALAPDPAAAARAFIEQQLASASVSDAPGFWASQRFETLDEPVAEYYEHKPAVLLRELVAFTILRAVHSNRQLLEVMAGFWSDHFNIDPAKSDCAFTKTADDRDVIRRHALGRFPELLRASVLSPAMLWYLDGQANRAGKPGERPNENHARELLELHTLGVDGGYTQHDVMEAARCLSGWTVHPLRAFRTAKVEFIAEHHDDGEKLVLGQRMPSGGGPRDLDRLLEILARHPSTARHIARKLARAFVHDDAPADSVDAAAAAFAATGGDIPATLRALFSAPSFWTSRGNLIKRPLHFVVSSLRATGARTDAGPALVDHLHRMGHAPFNHPTPDGYPREPHPWMGSLLWRWSFALALAQGRIKGTSLRLDRLVAQHGGEAGALAHVLGRQPTALELRVILNGPEPLALALASPAFQVH